MRISRTLSITMSKGMRMVSCNKCESDIASAEDSWKSHAALQEQRMNSLGEPFSTGDEVIMRSFACPACGALLDTEIAMQGDAFLEDRIF